MTMPAYRSFFFFFACIGEKPSTRFRLLGSAGSGLRWLSTQKEEALINKKEEEEIGNNDRKRERKGKDDTREIGSIKGKKERGRG